MVAKKPEIRVSICSMPSSQPAIFRLLPDFIGQEVVVLFFVVVALLAAFLVLLWLVFRR